MKSIACVLILAAVAVAEPPLFRQQYRFQRQELAEGPSGGEKTDDVPYPYPAAGFRPAKEFNLPSRVEVAPPQTSYGVPDTSYGAPVSTVLNPEYGVPEEKMEDVTTEKPESKEEKKENLEEAPKNEAEVVSSQGAYYVLLPGSQLQRVQFQTDNDITNMAYTARLQYRNEDRAPLYVYTAVPQYKSAAYVQLY